MIIALFLITTFFSSCSVKKESRLLDDTDASQKSAPLQIKKTLREITELEVIRDIAKKNGVEVHLTGHAAARLMYFTKMVAGVKKSPRHIPEYLNVFGDSPLILDVKGASQSIKAFEKALLQRLPHLKNHARPTIRKLSKKRLAEGSINLSTGTPQGEIHRDIMAGEIKAGINRIKSLDGKIFAALEIVDHAQRYGLTIPESTLTDIAKLFSRKDVMKSIADIDSRGKMILDHLAEQIPNSINVNRTYEIYDKSGIKAAVQDQQEKIVSRTGLGESKHQLVAAFKPIEDKPLGDKGKTAAELGIEFFTHASDRRGYYGQVRPVDGSINLIYAPFSTRYGEGYYGLVGPYGEGDGYSVRLLIHPEAREGIDFHIIRELDHPGSEYYKSAISKGKARTGAYILIVNKRAVLGLKHETIPNDPVKAFKLLASKQFDKGFEEGLENRPKELEPRSQRDNKHIVDRIRWLIGSQDLTTKQQSQMAAVVKSKIPQLERFEVLFSEWFDLPVSEKHPEIVEALMASNNRKAGDMLAKVFSRENWEKSKYYERFTSANARTANGQGAGPINDILYFLSSRIEKGQSVTKSQFTEIVNQLIEMDEKLESHTNEYRYTAHNMFYTLTELLRDKPWALELATKFFRKVEPFKLGFSYDRAINDMLEPFKNIAPSAEAAELLKTITGHLSQYNKRSVKAGLKKYVFSQPRWAKSREIEEFIGSDLDTGRFVDLCAELQNTLFPTY